VPIPLLLLLPAGYWHFSRKERAVLAACAKALMAALQSDTALVARWKRSFNSGPGAPAAEVAPTAARLLALPPNPGPGQRTAVGTNSAQFQHDEGSCYRKDLRFCHMPACMY